MWNENSQMVSGQKATLESIVCQQGICVPQFSLPDGPEVSKCDRKYDIHRLRNSSNWLKRVVYKPGIS